MKKNALRLTILCATLSLPLFTTTSCLTEDIIEDIINVNFEYQKLVPKYRYFLDFEISLDNGLKIDLEIDGK